MRVGKHIHILFLVLIAFSSVSINTHAYTCTGLLLRTDPTTVYASRDLWLNFFRKTNAHSDFKFLSDLVQKKLTETERRSNVRKAKVYRERIYKRLLDQGMSKPRALKLSQTAYARRLIETLFKTEMTLKPVKNGQVQVRQSHLSPPENQTLNEEATDLSTMVQAIEEVWPTLIRRSIVEAGGSRIENEEPVLIAGGRFKEPYYWDSFFGSFGLTLSGRGHFAFGQLKNFINQIKKYGFIPNGSREYYLTRSQPPVVSMMARSLLQASKSGLIDSNVNIEDYILNEALDEMVKDYNHFWMDKRLNLQYELNHYSDFENKPRPERHSTDDDTLLGEEYVDVRGEAESGEDFTNAMMGKASKVLPVQLNAFLYSYETDLAHFYTLLKDKAEPHSEEYAKHLAAAEKYQNLAALRKKNILNNLKADDGSFRNFDPETQTFTSVISADAFSLLFSGMLDQDDAKKLKDILLTELEKPYGLAASNDFNSTKQWDGNHGWAPFHIMAISGLEMYGFHEDAQRIAKKWLLLNLKVFKNEGRFFEKLDVASESGLPESDAEKYPNQTGFLWTNSSVLWTLNYLGFKIDYE